MYRVGTVHLRHPKQLENTMAVTPVLSWGVMVERTEDFDYPAGGKAFSGTHLRPVRVGANKTILPVSLKALFADFIAACEYFARQLEAEEAAGGHALRASGAKSQTFSSVPTRLNFCGEVHRGK